MKRTSITIVTYRNCAVIELKHNDEVVMEAQEYKNGFKLPLKGILKAFCRLIKLKIKHRGWKIK